MNRAAGQWLRKLLRAGKKQQRTVGKLMSALLKPPKPAKPGRSAKPPARPAGAAPRTRAKAEPYVPPARGKWLAATYSAMPEHGALPLRRLRYWLYLPDTAPPAAGLPLVVMLHGCEQSATLFAQGTRMNQLAERAGYAVLYPQQSLGAHAHRCWRWYDKATQAGGGDTRVIAGTIEAVAAKYPIDRSRIYIGGISAGAAMANIVALNHPQLIAALGMHSGPVFGAGHGPVGALGVMQRGAAALAADAIGGVLARSPGFPSMPAIVIQGARDTVVRAVNLEQIEQQLMLLNGVARDAAVEVVEKAAVGKRSRAYQLRDVYLDGKLLLRSARIAELAHAWSGGDGTLSFNASGGPDASRMMLDFFARHRRAPAP